MKKSFSGWSVVAATAVALTLCGTTFAVGAFGILTAYIGKSTGWSQGAMSLGLSIFLISATVAVPFVGKLTDRFGSRRVALAGIFAMAAAVAGGALIGGSIWTLYLFYMMTGVTGAFTNPVAYLRAITLWFDRQRGLAIGLAVAGQGAGGALLPVMVQGLASHFGWRAALLAIAGVMVFVIAPVVAIWVKDDPADLGQTPDGDVVETLQPARSELQGLTLSAALRTPAFWLILIVLGLFGLTTYAVAGQVVFILTHQQGLTLGEAALLQTVGGIALLVGRVIFGWFMDRWPISIVGAVGVLFATVGMAMLLTVHGFGPMALLRSVLIGASSGAETDLLTLLVGRYFGKRSLAEIYSWHNVAFLVGAAAGPPLFGLAVMIAGAITAPILGVAAVTVVAAALLLTLGLYPEFAPDEPPLEQEAALAAPV